MELIKPNKKYLKEYKEAYDLMLEKSKTRTSKKT